MKYICPNRNPHIEHLQIVSKAVICKYCRQKVIFWECSCGARVHFDPLDKNMYGDHRFSCLENYGKNPFKKEGLSQIQKVQIKEWNYDTEFSDVLEEYKNISQTPLELKNLDNYYYCGNCSTFRPIDSTVMIKNNKRYIWCQCGNQKILTIPFFGEKQIDFLREKIKLCEHIILNYSEQYYEEISLLIYFGTLATSFLKQEDLMTFMFINHIYQQNFKKILFPSKHKCQSYLRKMIDL